VSSVICSGHVSKLNSVLRLDLGTFSSSRTDVSRDIDLPLIAPPEAQIQPIGTEITPPFSNFADIQCAEMESPRVLLTGMFCCRDRPIALLLTEDVLVIRWKRLHRLAHTTVALDKAVG
jgi:hypothetical protein